jgi:RpiR family carbohydrate utilization transcriptional regulator
VFLGHGASHIVAQDAAQKFPLFGVPCSAPGDTHQQYMMASMATEGVVVTLISNTGHTASILELARISKDNGASVIGMAGAQSPLTEIVDVALIVETLENTDLFTPTISRIASLVLIDVLSTGVALLRPDSHVSRIQKMKASLADLRTGSL